MPKSKFREHFSIQYSPEKLPKSHLRKQKQGIFGQFHFAFFALFFKNSTETLSYFFLNEISCSVLKISLFGCCQKFVRIGFHAVGLGEVDCEMEVGWR